MQQSDPSRKWIGILPALPVGAKVMLTIFLFVIGCGYLVAVANIFYSHRMADGKAGLSVDDIRAVYSGMEISRRTSDEIPSRMLTMVRGAMRQYIEDEADFATLETWLKTGAVKEAMSEGAEPRKTPERAIIRNCLRCHAQSTESDISRKAPFGPDDLTVDYEMMKPLLATVTSTSVDRIQAPPQYTLERLVLISHQHMLAIPVFTVIVGLLFMTTRRPVRGKAWLTPLPMMAVVLDFIGWWLSRTAEPMVLVIAAAGGVFGMAFGFQIIAVAVDLWRPIRRIMG